MATLLTGSTIYFIIQPLIKVRRLETLSAELVRMYLSLIMSTTSRQMWRATMNTTKVSDTPYIGPIMG